MSATRQGEIQILAEAILLQLGQRMRAGQMVIHFSEGIVQRVEVNTVHKPMPRPISTAIPIDTAMR